MGFELFCMTLIALMVGTAVCFNGYRWFLVLLPLLAFFFGFGLGAQTLQALFGIGFISTVTSWIVGFGVGMVFAVLSYLFYIVGVTLVAGSFGYSLGVGFMQLIGFDLAIISWVVGMVTGIVVALGTLLLNIQKWVIITITAFGGAGIIVGTFLFMFGKIEPADFGANVIGKVLADSPLWMLFFIVLGIIGYAAQVATTRMFVLETPENRI